MDREAGFTLIELIIVIVIIGILLTISGFMQQGVLVTSRDTERANDTASIARLLEDDYMNQVLHAPAYPSIDTFTSDIGTLSGTAEGADPGIFEAPGATSSSVVGAPNPAYPSSAPALNTYVYQPLTSANQLCQNSSQTCVLYRLYYQQEATHRLVVLESAYQQ